LNNERLSWSSQNTAGAYASLLKWTMAGVRFAINGSLNDVGGAGYNWSSTVSGSNSRFLTFSSSNAFIGDGSRGSGLAVRCLKN
jgi:hypothetical protein